MSTCALNSTLTFVSLFFFNDTATPEIYTLSLHDALPIFLACDDGLVVPIGALDEAHPYRCAPAAGPRRQLAQVLLAIPEDRKSTRLNSSHTVISYAVFCLKKKTR